MRDTIHPNLTSLLTKALRKFSFVPENQIERLLAEAGFSNITRFYSPGFFAGWICQDE